MASQQIIFTVLPLRIDQSTQQAVLHLFVSPRLKPDSDTRLVDLTIPDFQNWPATVRGVGEWTVEFQGRRVGARLSALDAGAEAYWQALFEPHTTLVRPYEFQDFSSRAIRSFQLREIMTYLRDLYRKAANDWPARLPELQSDLAQEGLAKRLHEEMLETASEVDLLFAQKGVLGPGQPPGCDRTEVSFYQAALFYDRKPVPAAAGPALPDFDFHDVVATLGDRPEILRKLGLVLELRVGLDDLPAAPATFPLRLVPPWPQTLQRQVFAPWTMCEYTGDRFQARPRAPGAIRQGMLNLGKVDNRFAGGHPTYDLVQLDADGAALKLLHSASRISHTLRELDLGRLPQYVADDAALPSLRSAGIGLAHYGRAEALHDYLKNRALARNNVVESGGEFQPHQPLYAEDLVRGYRPDVWDGDAPAPQWRSLCKRAGEYNFPGRGVAPIAVTDEGYVKGASTTSEDAEQSDLYLHEILFRWDGWSLCVERPGLVLEAGKPDPGKPVSQAVTSFKLEPRFDVPEGTLPRLRFGHTYRLRVRLVDLAGNSVPADSEEEEAASEPLTYGRFEPLSPPAIMPRARMTQGEAVERLVIRSNYNQSAAQYAASPLGQEHDYTPGNERHVVPPKTSQWMAETHGALDPWLDAGRYTEAFAIAAREKGTLADGAEIVGPPHRPEEQYPIHSEPDLALPYLPDPIARGAAFVGLPDLSPAAAAGLEVVRLPLARMSALKVPFDLDWPDAEPFRIRIEERAPGSMRCRWDGGSRLLTVYLAKAEWLKVRYGCYLDAKALEQMALWQWFEEAQLELLRELACAGSLWLLTPWRDLELVHAVQQPLVEPQLTSVRPAERKAGETTLDLSGRIKLDRASTGRVEILADWHEPVDDPLEEECKTLTGQAHLGDREVASSAAGLLRFGGMRYDFGDTKHRRVNLRVRGTTRFREYFPASLRNQPGEITRAGPRTTLNVLSTGRPPAPKVLYVVPSFGWETKRTSRPRGPLIERTRSSGGLRVYLERPWYVSGEGELLGVVLWGDPDPSTIPDDMGKLVTQFGRDPTWESEPMTGGLTPEDLEAPAFTSGSPVVLAKPPEFLPLPGASRPVRVVGFPVHYNRERRLWYCDICFSAARLTSYFPFVRLALARFQPDSIGGQELSPVVQTDYAQLLPERRLSIGFINPRHFQVSLSGYSKGSEHVPPRPSDPGYMGPWQSDRVVLTIETREDGLRGEPLGWVPYNAQVLERTAIGDSHEYRWQGNMRLPAPLGSQPFRLVVKEYEPYEGEMTRLWEVGEQEWYDVAPERVVYADAVEV